jgi:phage-related minor tail protein
MPLPAFYTEVLFADFLVGVLGEVADAIGWDAGSVQVLEAVNDALLHYGTTAITDVAQQKFDRQQINAQALAMLKIADADCQAAGVGSGLSIGRLTLDFLEPATS